MREIEIKVVTDNVRKVLDVLEDGGIKPLSVKDIEAVARITKPKRSNGKEGCCDNESEDKSLPSLTKRVMNYVEAQVEHTLAGRPLVSKEEYLRRLGICSDKNVCDRLNSDWHCSECGCPMKVKAEWEEQPCKLNKW